MEIKDIKEVAEQAFKEGTASLKGELEGQIKSIKDAQELAAKAETVTKLVDTVGELSTSLDDLGAKMQNFGKGGDQNETIFGIVEKSFDKIKVAEKSNPAEFTVKASVLASTAVTSTTISQRDNTLSPLAHRTLTMYDLFRKIPVSADANATVTYTDWDTGTTARAAAAIAEGAVFPESTARWVELSVKLQKIGDTIPVSEEMLYDQMRFANELQAFLTQNVDLKVDNDLLLANGTAPNIKGLDAYATAYTAAAAGITDASIYDLIEKVDESITTNKGSKFAPNVIIMCIADINKMKLKKDANNNYIMPPFVGRFGQEVGGKIIIRNDNVTANTMYVGDSRYGTIYEAGEGYTVTVGEVDDQFAKDMKTIKARKRLALLIKNSEVAAWRKVSSISAALVTLAT